MARAAMVTLASAAQDVNGTLFMLGGFTEAMLTPALPVRQSMTFVARVELDEEQLGQPLLFVVRFEHEDGEQLVRVEAAAQLMQAPTYDERLPIGLNLLVPLFLDIRREGIYYASVSEDGNTLGQTPLKIVSQLPTM